MISMNSDKNIMQPIIGKSAPMKPIKKIKTIKTIKTIKIIKIKA